MRSVKGPIDDRDPEEDKKTEIYDPLEGGLGPVIDPPPPSPVVAPPATSPRPSPTPPSLVAKPATRTSKSPLPLTPPDAGSTPLPPPQSPPAPPPPRPKSMTAKGRPESAPPLPPSNVQRARTSSRATLPPAIPTAPKSSPAVPIDTPAQGVPVIQATSMKAAEDAIIAKPKQPQRREIPQVKLRPIGSIDSGAIAAPKGRLAPPQDEKEARRQRLWSNTFWASIAVIIASLVALAIWLIAGKK